jgi:hypothetical protein
MEDIRKPYNHLLGALRLTTSDCSRLRAQASKLAHVLATDPRRLGSQNILKGGGFIKEE